MSFYPAAALIEVPPAVLPSAALEGLVISEQTARYEVRLAQTAAEVAAALRLRFAVFNLELGEGLAESYRTGRDEDEFDRQCWHLLVCERRTGAVVGTYRLQTHERAQAGQGWYAATEFELTHLPAGLLADALELGRACIAPAHRHTEVLLLLWRGIAACVQACGKRYVFGCCSLASQDPRAGWALTQQLAAAGHLHPAVLISPQPGFECFGQAEPELGDNAEALPAVEVPKLLRSYLRLGAKVCGPPALDRQFQTIDFFVLLDVAALDARARRLLWER